jgi:hypothetical protein
MRKHANVAYNQQRLADGDMFTTVRLQSWFGEKRERYWEVVVVDDNNNNNDDNNDDSHQVVWEHQAIQEIQQPRALGTSRRRRRRRWRTMHT